MYVCIEYFATYAINLQIYQSCVSILNLFPLSATVCPVSPTIPIQVHPHDPDLPGPQAAPAGGAQPGGGPVRRRADAQPGGRRTRSQRLAVQVH